MAAGHDEVASSVDSEARTMTAMAMSPYAECRVVRPRAVHAALKPPPFCTSPIAPLLQQVLHDTKGLMFKSFNTY